jgi:hypothetical protein
MAVLACVATRVRPGEIGVKSCTTYTIHFLTHQLPGCYGRINGGFLAEPKTNAMAPGAVAFLMEQACVSR